jgi:hypothetical protein
MFGVNYYYLDDTPFRSLGFSGLPQDRCVYRWMKGAKEMGVGVWTTCKSCPQHRDVRVHGVPAEQAHDGENLSPTFVFILPIANLLTLVLSFRIVNPYEYLDVYQVSYVLYLILFDPPNARSPLPFRQFCLHLRPKEGSSVTHHLGGFFGRALRLAGGRPGLNLTR